MTAQISFDNSYARLPASFYARLHPVALAAPRLVKLNVALAERLGLDPDALASPGGAREFSGARFPDGAEPIAMAYAGHQFGHFVPQLGDGRAMLLGEIVAPDGARFDLQLKGSGPTPFSRNGDGRAALGPVLREYIVSEAMAALGIATTRALAVVATGESVFRETLLPGAVLTRVASSHIRVGTFQFFAARRDEDGLMRLADHAIARHYPGAASQALPYHALLQGVVDRQARLVARWMLVGFVHGVMNTDNMAISGETIDYGPCAFLDVYDPVTVFSSIDRAGRYAYANQPGIAQWNLTRLAECLLPLMAEDEDRAIDEAKEILSTFAERFQTAYLGGMRTKLGLFTEKDGDLALAQDLLDRMAAGKADFTLTFRRLCVAQTSPDADASMRALFPDPALYDDWALRWRARLGAETRSPAERRAAMRQANPLFIPRNHRVEEAIAAAYENDDFGPFDTLVEVLATPFEDQPERAAHADLPPASDTVYRTFCGT